MATVVESAEPSETVSIRHRQLRVVKAFLRRIESYIPQTDEFDKWANEEVEAGIAAYKERFAKLLDNTEYDVNSLVVTSFRKLALHTFWADRVASWTRTAGLTLAAVLGLAVPIAIARLMQFSPAPWEWLAIELLSVVAAAIVVVLFVSAGILVDGVDQNTFGGPVLKSPAIALTAALIGWLSYAFLWPHDGQFRLRLFAAAAGVAAAFTFMPLVFVALLALRSVQQLAERRKFRRMPQSAAIDAISRALEHVTAATFIWGSQFNRRLLITHVEEAALCIERFVPETIRTGDAATDAWTRAELQKRAAGLREMERTILAAGPDKRPEIVVRMKTALIALINFDWQSLPAADPVKLTPRERLSSRALAGVRAIAVAAMPTTVLILIARPGSPLYLEPGDLLNWTRLGLAIWVVVALLPLIDPGYRATSQAARLIGQLPFIGHKRREADDESKE